MERPARTVCKYCGGLGYVQDLDEKDGKPVFVRNKCPECKGFKYKIVKS